MTVNAFFDESGKFKDHKIISFGGVAAFAERLNDFGREWGTLLHQNGLRVLSAKRVLNWRIPLSAKNTDVGLSNRIRDLLPFIRCIRKHLDLIMVVAIDVKAYKQLPSHYFQMLGDDPIFTAFARAMMWVTDYTPDQDKVSLVCDDEEQIAWSFYRLYRRVRKVYPQARNKFVAISFADDRFLYGLQAADLVSSVVRLEAGRKMARVPHDYGRLFNAITAKPDLKQTEKIWEVYIAWVTKKRLTKLAEDMKVHWEKAQELKKAEQDAGIRKQEYNRVRKIRPRDAATDKGSAQQNQGNTGRRKGSKGA